MGGPRRKAGRRALGLAAAALLLELALRFGLGLGDPPLARRDPETEYELVPSASYRRRGARVEINAYGMRGRDPVLPRPANERRILLIGDSVVYGTHGLDQAETIAAALERRLAEMTGCDALALPLAASSWGPVNQLAALEKAFAQAGDLGVEAAVVILSAHDLHDVPVPGDRAPYRLSRPWGAIGDAVELAAERLRRPGRSPALPETRGAASSDIPGPAAQSLAALGAMIDRLAGAGIAPLLAYHPTLPERRGAPRPERAVFRDEARERDVRFLDLGAAVPGAGGYLDDIHPDAAGAAGIAAALADALGPGPSACGG